ncbi:hypothetical protein [Mesorhizobium shangrilense]|uniref:PilZ domain-containing protein n=1 Tax=Mesorhizobium shangrilense TaxID=460060 RepID=A0ABV2DLQ5_9HYPH
MQLSNDLSEGGFILAGNLDEQGQMIIRPDREGGLAFAVSAWHPPAMLRIGDIAAERKQAGRFVQKP